MRFFLLLLTLLLLSACRPVHQTKLYYDEYINPVRTVDYDDTIEADFPEAGLQHYYTIDRQLVDFTEQLGLVDEEPDASWISVQKKTHSWLKAVAVFDDAMTLISGDEFLGYDPAVREAVLLRKDTGNSFMLYLEGRTFLIKANTAVSDRQRYAVAEMDLDSLVSSSSDVTYVFGIADHVVGSGLVVSPEKLTKIHSSTKYSGSFRDDGQEIWWIRSMAANDFVYLYKD